MIWDVSVLWCDVFLFVCFLFVFGGCDVFFCDVFCGVLCFVMLVFCGVMCFVV